MTLHDDIQEAYANLSAGDTRRTAELAAAIEPRIAELVEGPERSAVLANMGALITDLGEDCNDVAMIERGIHFSQRASEELPSDDPLCRQVEYNIANGFSLLWSFRSPALFEQGELGESYLNAKDFYRRALDRDETRRIPLDTSLAASIMVNYANSLDSVSRCVEAIDFYDRALKLAPTMGQALGNKAITLHSLAFLAQGHTHQFLLEAFRLLDSALKAPIDESMAFTFRQYQASIQAIIDQHEEMQPEPIPSQSASTPFQELMQSFCVRHRLYLTPTALIGLEGTEVHGDPLYFSRMTAPLSDRRKFDRYQAFFNEIKQDYVVARHLLIQSQFQSDDLDGVDQRVTLYYPLDYSLSGMYIQMLKTALKSAVDILDKVAFFVRDYCEVTSLAENRVSFRNLWSTSKQAPYVLRPELQSRQNRFLFALLDLSLDVRTGGCWSHIYESRNTLTHRFMTAHEMTLSERDDDGLHRIPYNDLFSDAIQAMQMARAALFYLVLFIEEEERRTDTYGRTAPVLSIPVTDTLRWRPPDRRR